MGDFNKYTPLIYAAQKGHFDLVEAMIENVPRLNINKGDKFKRSPLLFAARNGRPRILALLLKNHALGTLPDTSGNTPVHYAAAYGHL